MASGDSRSPDSSTGMDFIKAVENAVAAYNKKTSLRLFYPLTQSDASRNAIIEISRALNALNLNPNDHGTFIRTEKDIKKELKKLLGDSNHQSDFKDCLVRHGLFTIKSISYISGEKKYGRLFGRTLDSSEQNSRASASCAHHDHIRLRYD